MAQPTQRPLITDPRMVALALLGFSSGLPLLLIYSTLSFWLMEEGLTIATVGLFAATSTPYSLKFLWAPLLDRLPLPGLTRWLGRRRGFLLPLQLALMGAIGAVALTDPATNPTGTAIAAIVVAALSASQDVVVDAYRVERLQPDEQGAGAAAAVFGYRIGMLVSGAGALYLAHYLESWPLAYASMAACMLVGIVTTLVCKEPAPPETGRQSSIWREIKEAVVGPLKGVVRRRGWVLFLVFVMLYKLGDALTGAMTNPLLIDLGFDKLTIANIAKSYGLAASLLGVFVGGAMVHRLGIVRSLWIAGLLQMASNLVFALQAHVGLDPWLLIGTIGVENFTGGLGTAAFVAYLSALCDRTWTASQYAMLTATAGLLRTVLSSSSGELAEWLGWVPYFGLTTLAALPGLILLALLVRRGWTGLEPA